jgi:hypothetical protein
LLAIAQLVKLSRLGAQHASQMLGGLAAEFRASCFEFFNEEASPHHSPAERPKVEKRNSKIEKQTRARAKEQFCTYSNCYRGLSGSAKCPAILKTRKIGD